MKKFYLTIFALVLTTLSAWAQYSPTATSSIYDDLSKFGDGILDLFYTADKAGRKYPTDAEFEKAGYSLSDIAFVRSHVRKRDILSRETRLNTSTYQERNLWMNIPIGVGKDQGGYPSSNVSDDTFSGWNYTNLFGSWNHGLFHVPAVAVDCAHKNGTDIMGGIKFFESWTAGSGASGWVSKVQLKDNNGYGGYAYVRPLVNACLYFGSDGINYNFEDEGYSNCKEFHAACYKYAASIGFTNFHVGLYTASSCLTSSNVGDLYGNSTTGQCYDTFLNYSASNFADANTISNSVNVAERALGTCEDVYQGAWIVSMARSWSNLVGTTQQRMGIVLWGEHSQSRLYSYNTGNDPVDFEENYQKLQDRFFSGGYRNPASTPTATNEADWQLEDQKSTALRTFQGVGYYIPERTAIKQNLPFTTFFNIGNGDRYNYKGKKTLGSWYNLGQQDVVPTYRWLVYKKGTTTPVKDETYVQNNTTMGDQGGIPYFTNSDAYIGGSCLKLTNSSAVDIVLYRGEITASSTNPKATIALKRYAGAPAGTVSVIVKKKGSSDWLETKFKNVSGNTWEEQTEALNGISQGDVIEYVGLRTSGNTDGLLVGELSLNDDSRITPADIDDNSVVADVRQETQKSLSVKLRWDMVGTPDEYDRLFNDELNIDHFEIFYKDGENGHKFEVGRTTTWSALASNIPLTETSQPYIGVAGLSVDGKTHTPIHWVKITRAESSNLPETSTAIDAYPEMIINVNGDDTKTALNCRYITGFIVKDDSGKEICNYFCNESASDKDDQTNYTLADEDDFDVEQGKTYSCELDICKNDDGLQYCNGRGYADWDGDCLFNAFNDECIWTSGEDNCKHANSDFCTPSSNTYVTETLHADTKFTFTVPSDAKSGASRLRFVFSDAWFPHPGPAGCNQKGCSLDIPIKITGTNTPCQAVDTHDKGTAEDPVITGIENITEPSKQGVSQASIKDDQLSLQNVDKVWIYSADGRLVKFMKGNVTSLPTEGLKGAYLIKMQYGNIIRTKKLTF